MRATASTASTASAAFVLSDDVLTYQAGVATISHPVVGTVVLFWEAMELVGDNGLTLIAYGAEPGSETAERLQLLAAWTAPEVGVTGIPVNGDRHDNAL